MKRVLKASVAAVALLLAEPLVAVTASSGPVTPGEWNTDWQACRDFAISEGTPIMAVWGQYGCHFCQIFDGILEKEYFINWAKEKGLIMAYVKGNGWASEVPWITGKGTKRQIGGAPGVRIYWEKDGQVLADEIFEGRISKIGGQTGEALVAKIMSILGDWDGYDVVKYNGGSFSFEESEGNRLEAEDGTTVISFDLTRDEKIADLEAVNIVSLEGPNGVEVSSQTVKWREGETKKTVTVDISAVKFSKEGDEASIVIKDEEGEEQALTHVTYVTENSASNPLWIGERKATATRSEKPVLEYGEWTMDLDVAKAKVAAENGQAYTLVSVQGSLWCHDCANTERNFGGVKDGSGNNRLAAWAKQNKVALVAIDIPNFTANTVECASPTLLSRSAYTTTLAYELPSYGMYDVSKGGAPESLTNPMMRSGLGYLTRKGVSDADARKVLERNHTLVTTDFTEGGFRTAADSNKFRTGVPIFVLLDKAGNVKARFTRFASVSPMADAKSKWDDVIKRFDEMLAIAKTGSAHADGGVVEDDFPGSGIHGIAAAGGSVKGEISHCDLRDTYKLENFDGNALLQATAKGSDHAEVTLSIVKLGADGKKVTVASQAGVLDDGVMLVAEIETSGEFFVEISGAGDDDAFSAFNPAKQAFHAYEIDCDVILIPGEMRSKAFAPKGSSTVSMLIEADALYRIEGLANDHGAALQKVADNFYVSTVETEEGFSYEDMKTSSPGGTVVYQRWEPGVVGFVSEKKTVTESVGDVKVDFARELGMSGEVTVRVSLDESATTLYNSDGGARFEFAPVEFTWAEGESGTASAVVTVKDDARFDGPGVVALKLEVVSSENSDVEAVAATYKLTVNEDDKQAAGKVAFTGAEPFFSKKGTVYARESEGATVYVERIEASDGFVTAKVNATNGAKTEIGGVETNVVVWANHKYERQAVKVTGIAAGKSAKLTLSGPTDGLKVLTASNSVTVVAVADNAPAFANDAEAVTLYRYVTASNVYPVVFAPGVDAATATLSFTKLSGTLPSGLKAAYDSHSKALAIYGATTAKPGDYKVAYQVTQQVGSTKTPGLVMELTITVVDPTVAGSGVPFNAAIAAQNGKSRTVKDVAVLDVEGRRLAGVMTITIPAKGNASAKYTCAAGTVSFSAKGWSAFDPDTKDIAVALGSSKKGYSMTLTVGDDGEIDAQVVDPGFNNPLIAEIHGKNWSKEDSAEAKKGYYTIALVPDVVEEKREGTAPRGCGYLTLKMDKASDWNAGKMTWAGMLPSGTAVSGSTTLAKSDCDALDLPIFKSSTTDVLAVLLNVCDIVTESTDAESSWTHMEKAEELGYTVLFDANGGHYDATADLAEAFAVGYPDVQVPTLAFNIEGLAGRVDGRGVPADMSEVAVSISAAKLSVPPTSDKVANPNGVTMSFSRPTGVVKGSFKLPYVTEAGVQKTITAQYQGVVMLGFGVGCGCDRPEEQAVELPFVVGSFFVSDKEVVGTKTFNVKRGGAATVE